MRSLRTVLFTFLALTVHATAALAVRNADDIEVESLPPQINLANVNFISATVQQAACGRVRAFGQFSVDGTINDGGGQDQGAFDIYDDGVYIGGGPFSVAVGATVTFTYDIVVTHTIGAPGVALSIREVSQTLAAVAFINITEVPIADCPPLGVSIVSGVPQPAIPAPVFAPLVVGLLALLLAGLGLFRLRRQH
jgi:hypothetical protein